MKHVGLAIPVMAAVTAAAIGGLSTPARGASAQARLYLHVGPAVRAQIRTAEMHLSCSDSADCAFDVRSNAAYEIVASASGKREFQWTGCSARPAADRCQVEIAGAPVVISVK